MRLRRATVVRTTVRWPLLIVLAASSASAAPTEPAAPTLIRTIQLAKRNDRFSFQGHLRFVDEHTFIAIAPCKSPTDHPALLGGSVKKASTPKRLATLQSCEAFIGDDVIVDIQKRKDDAYWVRYDFTGKKLDERRAPYVLKRILGASRTTIVASVFMDDVDDRTPALVALREYAITATDRAIELRDQQFLGLGVVLEADGVVVPSSTGAIPDRAQLYRWTFSTKSFVATPIKAACMDLWKLPSGELLCRTNATLVRLDATLAPVATTEMFGQFAKLSADGTRVVTADFSVADPQGGVVVQRTRNDGFTELAISPSGHTALVGRGDGSLQLWSIP